MRSQGQGIFSQPGGCLPKPANPLTCKSKQGGDQLLPAHGSEPQICGCHKDAIKTSSFCKITAIK